MALLVLTTLPSKAQASALSRKIVTEGLAACVSVVPGLESVYRWQGKVTRSRECLLLIKTTRSRWKRLERFILKHHPYGTPECIGLPITIGLKEYLAWLKKP